LALSSICAGDRGGGGGGRRPGPGPAIAVVDAQRRRRGLTAARYTAKANNAARSSAYARLTVLRGTAAG